MTKLLDRVSQFFKPARGLTQEQYLAKLLERGLDENGKFEPDATPMAPPIGYKKQPSMVEIVRNMVRSERLAAELAAQGQETFEEADDFDVDDDPPDMRSGWENDFDPPVSELVAAGREVMEARRKAQEERSGEAGVSPAAKPKPPVGGSEAAERPPGKPSGNQSEEK